MTLREKLRDDPEKIYEGKSKDVWVDFRMEDKINKNL